MYDDYENIPDTLAAVQVNEEAQSIVVTVPIEALGGEPEAGWGFSFIVAGENNGGICHVLNGQHEGNFGGGSNFDAHSHIIDMTVPEGTTQEAVIDWTNGSVASLG